MDDQKTENMTGAEFRDWLRHKGCMCTEVIQEGRSHGDFPGRGSVEQWKGSDGKLFILRVTGSDLNWAIYFPIPSDEDSIIQYLEREG